MEWIHDRERTSARRRHALAPEGGDGVQDDINVRVEPHRQFTSHFPFTKPGLRTAFTAKTAKPGAG
jgi:hypothetical protein